MPSTDGKKRVRQWNLLPAPLLFGLAGIMWAIGGVEHGFGRLSEPGPGFVGVVAGVTLAALAGWELASVWHTNVDERKVISLRDAWKVMVCCGAVLASLYIMHYFGFLIATLITEVILLSLFGEKGWLRIACLAVAISLVCYGVFGVLFRLPLPPGSVWW